MPELTKADMDELLQKQAKTFAGLVKSGGSSSSTSSSDAFNTSAGRFSSNMTDAADALNPLTKGFDMLGSVGSKVFTAFKEIYNATNENIGMMQSLSKSGMNFSSDVVGMTASMKGMRLSNEEFADIMTKNAAGFTALGGNATRGAEAFAKLSHEFMQSEFIDSLNTMGYTNKELNEVLALQVTTGKMALRDDKESRRAAIESAHQLAKEMDATAKLTGKSREEQMSTQQKLKDDMALEAKLRQQTQGMTDTQAAEYRKKVMQQMAEAELAGQGQVLKEKYVYGQIISDLAVQQEITAGRESMDAREKQAQLLRNKELASADEQGKIARTALISFQESADGLQFALLPGNEALSKSSFDLMKANQAQADAMRAIRQEEAFKNKTDREIEAEANRRIELAQTGKNKEGEAVSQTTETMIKLKNRAGDVESAFYNNLIVPLNRDIRPTMLDLNRTFLSPTLRRVGKPDISYEGAIGEGMATGYRRAKERPRDLDDKASQRYDTDTEVQIQANFQSMGLRLSDIHKNALTTAGDIFYKAAKGVNVSGQELIKMNRSTGSLGMTGKLIEDFGQGTDVTLHGRESVITEKQLMEMASGMKQVNVEKTIKELISSAQKMDHTISSKASGKNSINFDAPAVMKDMKVNPDEITQATQALMSQMTGYRDIVEQKSVAKKEPKSTTESATDTFLSTVSAEKKATLDDVVSSLNQLNIKLNQLVETNIDIGSKQIRAVQSTSRNLFERF